MATDLAHWDETLAGRPGPTGPTGPSGSTGPTGPAGTTSPIWSAEETARTDDFTAVPGVHYQIDPSGGSFTITLPASTDALLEVNPDCRFTWVANGSPVDLAPAGGDTISVGSAAPATTTPFTAAGSSGVSFTFSPLPGAWACVALVE